MPGELVAMAIWAPGLICDQYEPALVQMPENVPCRQVAAGTKHSMALSTQGTPGHTFETYQNHQKNHQKDIDNHR